MPPARLEAGAVEGAAQIALENVRQYFVPNEKEDQSFRQGSFRLSESLPSLLSTKNRRKTKWQNFFQNHMSGLI